MGWSGGVFSRVHNWVSDANSSIAIEADRHDAEDDNLREGINNCLTKDGQNEATANIPLGGYKLTNVGDATADTDALNRQTADARYLTSGVRTSQLRLTLSTGTPVMTSAVTGATTVYATPYGGTQVPIWNGTTFVSTDTGGELSQATTDGTKSPAAVTTNSNYDIFAWDDGGTIRATRGPAWTSGTARGTGAGTTELDLVDGVYVNKIAISNGPAAGYGTYLGTIRSNASSTIDWSLGGASAAGTAINLTVWNMYNRVRHVAASIPTTGNWSWVPSGAAIQAANGGGHAEARIVCGLADGPIEALYKSAVKTAYAAYEHGIGIGYDSTSAISGTGVMLAANDVTSPGAMSGTAEFTVIPIGTHVISPLEWTDDANTLTFYGASTFGYPTGLYIKGLF